MSFRASKAVTGLACIVGLGALMAFRFSTPAPRANFLTSDQRAELTRFVFSQLRK